MNVCLVFTRRRSWTSWFCYNILEINSIISGTHSNIFSYMNVVEQPFHDFLFVQAADFTCPVDDKVVSTVAFTASSRLLFLSKIQMNQVKSFEEKIVELPWAVPLQMEQFPRQPASVEFLPDWWIHLQFPNWVFRFQTNLSRLMWMVWPILARNPFSVLFNSLKPPQQTAVEWKHWRCRCSNKSNWQHKTILGPSRML